MFSGTVFENIAYGLSGATCEDVINAAKLAGAHEFIQTSKTDMTHMSANVELNFGRSKAKNKYRKSILKKSAYTYS